MNYKPRAKNKEILEWCLKRIQSVPYRVSARWLFYRLVEERGFTKSQYTNFLQYTSRARKRFYNGWKPDTLTDDTREAHRRGGGYSDEKSWVEHFRNEKAIFEKFSSQDNIVEIWFEAEAMYSQFDYYISPYCLSLIPFKGDASIDYKWKIAKHLEALNGMFPTKPIVVLYFGDYDEKGLQIPESAVKDIREWCKVPFRFIRCGINKEQIVDWGIVEAFDKKGTYQWEALSENKAKVLIVSNIEKFWSLKKIQEVQEEEEKATARWQRFISDAIEKLEDAKE